MITKLILSFMLGTVLYMAFNWLIYAHLYGKSSGGHSYVIILIGSYFVIQLFMEGGN